MRIGIVVQRYGEEVVGGAELHARWIAQRLAQRHQVEVLTTCALDYLNWENRYPEGVTELAGVPVRRFPTARLRTAEGFDQLSSKVHLSEHSEAEERRWMEEHGPVTPGLLKHLRDHQRDYQALIFFSYRYWTTFHGLQLAPQKSILVPTAEEDGTVRLELFKPFFLKPAAYAFNSVEERELLLRASGASDLPGEVVGVGIEDEPVVEVADIRRRLDLLGDFILYVGRIEHEKGCSRLFDDFLRFMQEEDRHLDLVLVGKPVLPIPHHPNIIHLGVLSDTEKLSAMGAARLLVHPSPFESLSMVLLEAWKMSRPALVNGRCPVLRGQVIRASGGLYYNSHEEFAETLCWLLDHRLEADTMGRSGRAYFEANYAWDVIMDKYERLLAMAAGG
ncbi:MAG TPA: glycosyltransferase family 4 protein [Vicinamibacteria bacterium]|nr:glycosyltransferase family 4 protein [Vicinamibacteria bacterium]